jgi:predicted nucleic acid-binding protein
VIVLDTNVVSELMRPEPAAAVVEWVDLQPADEVWLTSITLAELLFGIGRIPDERRKRTLASLVEAMVEEDFDHRIGAFDEIAATHYADIVVSRERAGRPISMPDAQIAAICRSHRATLATRNLSDFANTGVTTVNPWIDPPTT